MDATYDVDSRVGVLLAAAQHKEKCGVRGGGEGGRRRRRAWSPDGCSNQIKTRRLCTRHGAQIPARSMAAPPKQRRASCAKPKQKKTRANGKYAAKKHSQKGSARLFPLCSTLAVPGKCARTHRPRCARDLLSLAVQNHCSTRKQKKRFLSRVPKKTKRPAPAPGCSNVLQARGVCCNTHTMHGFCAIDGCVTGAGKDGLCTKHAAFGLCTLNTCQYCR